MNNVIGSEILKIFQYVYVIDVVNDKVYSFSNGEVVTTSTFFDFISSITLSSAYILLCISDITAIFIYISSYLDDFLSLILLITSLTFDTFSQFNPDCLYPIIIS